jgi:triacylglycerol esterase/lipase EstA (alpha/beta hydrolase family)
MMTSSIKSETVVLLHGIVGARYQVWPVARMLQKLGYNTLNISYPSTKLDLQALTSWIDKKIKSEIQKADRVHFVGYSLGGLICRAYIHRYGPPNLGRVVLLGAPNQGSEVADKLHRVWFYRKIFGPAGQALTTHNQQTQNLLGQVDYELGVIAGDRPIEKLGDHWIGKPNDGKVSVDSTHVKGEKDHIVLPVCHEGFCYFSNVRKQVQHFLEHGQFLHADSNH